jgi:trimethylamine-N-oxide reductase (cytochrome c)
MMSPAANLIKDISENAEMCLFWGCDPETTPWGFTGQYATRVCYFWTQAGIPQIYICPELNYGAAVHADKWIPVLPNTDAALQLAIIYTWIKEGTWNKEYVKTHAVGMDYIENYVLGRKTAYQVAGMGFRKCGVPEWTIKALAREFAKK